MLMRQLVNTPKSEENHLIPGVAIQEDCDPRYPFRVVASPLAP